MFEIRGHDLGGRLGRLQTRHGTIRTPALLPVISPTHQVIPPKEMDIQFGFEAIITNAYLLKKNRFEEVQKKGIHKLLDFQKSIMTDSGAYQLLVYGDVDIGEEEVLEFQQQIDSDIGVILDVPTGGKFGGRKAAEKTVIETIARAKSAQSFIKEDGKSGRLWTGPIQGGTHPELVKQSAEEMVKLDFDLYAIGSPTQLMEEYHYRSLFELVVVVKQNLPFTSPVHLFGAGHPMIFPLAIALGCDLFDSAAYALFARNERVLFLNGTKQLKEISENLCFCPACQQTPLNKLTDLPPEERTPVLARHNLWISQYGIQRCRQAIREGRLWELVQESATYHPRLLEAVRLLQRPEIMKTLEETTPVSKLKGLLYTGKQDWFRPEVYRHRNKLQQYTQPEGSDILVLLPQLQQTNLDHSLGLRALEKTLASDLDESSGRIHVCIMSIPFGLIPLEISGVFPLSQHESIVNPVEEEYEFITETLDLYLQNHKYKTVIVHHANEVLWKALVKTLQRIKVPIKESRFTPYQPLQKPAIGILIETIKEVLTKFK
ncbi:MAG: tRNA guanosine(15) transglycosylase TgtA [Candidatus Ranarchaeia archaeon]|jgi:7-cyano-7-deazaguanine tRNA-ribosyltransferase